MNLRLVDVNPQPPDYQGTRDKMSISHDTIHVATHAVTKGVSFLKRQPRDWQVTVARTSLASLCYQIVFPYCSIYTIALGATAVQLGMVNAVGMCVAGLSSPMIGCLIDRTGIKKIYLIGMFF